MVAMDKSGGFFVTLPSHASLTEFPDNNASSFKVRLPQPINFHEPWEVGLSSISLPDQKVNLFKLDYERDHDVFKTIQDEEVLFHMRCNDPILNHWSSYTLEQVSYSVTVDLKNDILKDADTIVDGVEFMKFCIKWLVQKIVRFAVTRKTYTHNNQRTFFDFEWKDKELWILQKTRDDADKDLDGHYFFDYVEFGINKKLALAMGWFLEDAQGTLWLSRNLVVADQINPVPVGWNTKFTLKTETLNGLSTEMICLSPYCTWKFVNINEAFQNILGSPSRTLFVYSDVGESTITGNQMTDLLREVKFQREGKGATYFEPRHVHYIPVRNLIIDMVEVQVAETNGKLVVFGAGHTILTLHFRKQ